MTTNGDHPETDELEEGDRLELIVTGGALREAVERGEDLTELDVVLHLVGTAIAASFEGDALAFTTIGFARTASGDVRIAIERQA